MVVSFQFSNKSKEVGFWGEQFSRTALTSYTFLSTVVVNVQYLYTAPHGPSRYADPEYYVYRRPKKTGLRLNFRLSFCALLRAGLHLWLRINNSCYYF